MGNIGGTKSVETMRGEHESTAQNEIVHKNGKGG